MPNYKVRLYYNVTEEHFVEGAADEDEAYAMASEDESGPYLQDRIWEGEYQFADIEEVK